MLPSVEKLLNFDEDVRKAAKVLRALNHPLRKRIIKLLERELELSVTEIYTTLRVEQSDASNHIGILRDAGILRYERRGKKLFYFIDAKRYAKVLLLASEIANWNRSLVA